MEPRGVGILGAAYTRFGERRDANMAELAWEAFREAIAEANLEPRDIGPVFVSNVGMWSSESLPAVLISEALGLGGGSMRVEAACSSGSAAVKAAYDAIASGGADVALALGVEKMAESTTPTVVELIGRGAITCGSSRTSASPSRDTTRSTRPHTCRGTARGRRICAR
jgi:acetyl-CoA C-acetyltransferase